MAPKKAQPAASVRRSNRIASKEAVSYTPTTARVVKQSPTKKTAAKKAPAKKSATPKAAPVKKAPIKKSAAPKKAPAIKKAPAKKVFITTTPLDSVPSSSKIIKYPTASKKKTPSPKKFPVKNSPAKASPKKSLKVVGSDETDEDERIPTATGIGSPRRLK